MTMVFTITAAAEPAAEQTGLRKTDLAESYEGKTVVLSTNDVHGAVDGYQYVKGLKTELESRGADVIMVDAGDFSQGDIYVSTNKGAAAINLMRLAGYDYATLGNHEFDFGPEAMNANIARAQATEGDGTPFKILCSNIIDNETNEPKYQTKDIYTKESMGDLKVGFVGVATPETQTKSLPTNFANVHFNARNDQEVQVLYDDLDAQVAALKEDGADVVFLLAHLGIDAESEPFRSSDVYEKMNNKFDMIIDGHSHTVMTAGANSEPIMSTGTKFQHIGVTVINEETKKVESNFLYQLKLLEDLVDKDGKAYQAYTTYFDDLDKDDVVGAYSKNLIDTVNEEYDATFAQTSVHLNGARSLEKSGILGNRDSETNLGDLIADSMMWYVKNRVSDLGVPDENIVAITNGGGIRATIEVGNVSKRSINSVLPFGNTIAAVTVTGAELLEALEASTYNAPKELGGFPQIAGMEVEVNTYLPYDKQDNPYPGSTYYGPKTIKRVKIKKVNGKDFDPAATYVVLTNNFCASGGDTYYAFANASNQFDTSIPLDEALMEYIYDELKCEIGDAYANPQGRLVFTTDLLKEAQEDLEKAKTAGDTQAVVDAATALVDIAERTGDMDIYKAAVNELKVATAKLSEEKNASDKELKAAKAKLNTAEKKLNSIAKNIKVVTVNSTTVTAKTIDAAVKKVGGSEKYVTKIVLGKKVKTVKAKALTKYKKVTTLEVKTTKLKKKTVKNSLKGSKVKTVKVSVGNKKVNKKYVKAYKKIFTKKNAGKSVKVK
ncbi:MAG: bifunctional metallophosphatase/5'-nucleotidase, partial [Mogibacterium sp.]|nr:bifunctional metallophosphatase/5'-nucleotidase [Mogibacterium sp.]